jgi:glycine/D-amino acid oxidase-like deaminating enzyme
MSLAESAAGDLPGLGNVLGGFSEILRDLEIECELNLPGAWELARSGHMLDSPIHWNDHGILRPGNEVPGGTINPGKLVSGLARAAERAGATVHENARVESVTGAEISSGEPVTLDVALSSDEDAGPARHVHGKQAPRRDVQIHAQRVLLATNAQTLEISGLSKGAHPKLTLAVATAPLSEQQLADIGLGDGKPFYTVDFPYLWGRVMPSRGVILGAGLIAVNDWRDLAVIGVADGEAATMIARIEQRVRGLHPALRKVEFTHRWGGPILFVEGMRPVFRWLPQGQNTMQGSLGAEASGGAGGSRVTNECRMLVLGAYAGHGVALSVYLGRWAAEVLLDRRKPPEW